MLKIANIEKRMGTASGTLFFTCSTLLVKIIGAVYKIPLYNLLGNDGVGLYQIVFPVYALLLTLSGGGIPSGMTKIISNGYSEKKVLKKSLKIFCPVGAIFSFILFFTGHKLAQLQGNTLAGDLYKAISPSVFIVCVLGCFRGYFQGKSNFIPSAFSQLTEQVVKAVSGVIALLFVVGDYQVKAFWACFAVTFSEIIALLFLLGYYYLKKKKEIIASNEILSDEKDLSYKQILLVIIPLTLSSLCLPLASFLDTFIAVNALKNTFGDQATAVFGVYTGGVDTIIALPVALLHSFLLGFLPKMNKENFSRSLFYNFILSFVCAIGIIIFAPLGASILFGKNNTYLPLLTRLLRVASFNVVLHSCLHAVAFFMLSIDKQKFSLVFLLIGVAVKLILSLTLIKIPQINVFGMIISDAGCYFVALILNLIYIKYIKKIKITGNNDESNLSRLGRRSKLPFGKSA